MYICKFSRKTCIHYVLLTLLIVLQNSLIFKVYDDLIIGICAISCVYVLLKTHPKIRIYGLVWIVSLCVILLISMISSSFSLSVTAVVGVIIRIVFSYSVYIYSPKDFPTRLVKVIFVFAIFSLCGYVISLVDSSVLMHGKKYELGYWVTLYQNYFYVYATNDPRNVGVFTEPGLYQIVLNAAIFILLFKEEKVFFQKETNKRICLATLSITLFTTLSTTGLIGFSGMFMCYLFFKRDNKQGENNKKIILFILIVILFIAWFNFGDFLYGAIFTKLFNSTGTFDMRVGTGKSRIVSMGADLTIANMYPLGAGFNKYSALWRSMLSETIPDTSSCVGLTKHLAVFGYPFILLILGYYIHNLLKNNKHFVQKIALLIIFLTTVFSQPELYFPIYLVLFLI